MGRTFISADATLMGFFTFDLIINTLRLQDT